MSDQATPAALRLSEGLGPLRPERAEFEAWFCEHYSYSRAVLTNPIWAREVADSADAFAAGEATARKRCETALRLAREGYSSEAATGLPVLPQWRERVLKMLDKALRA